MKRVFRCHHFPAFPVRGATGPNHASFRLITEVFRYHHTAFSSNYSLKQWLGRALCRREILLTERVNPLFIISPVTIFDCNRKLNKLWHVVSVCAGLKPKNMRAGRGLRDHLFWTLHFMNSFIQEKKNLIQEGKWGYTKDIKCWHSFTQNNHCYIYIFNFQHFWGTWKERHSGLSDPAILNTARYTYPLLGGRNNPLLFNTFWFNVDVTNCLYSQCLLYFSKNILIFSSAWKLLWFSISPGSKPSKTFFLS